MNIADVFQDASMIENMGRPSADLSTANSPMDSSTADSAHNVKTPDESATAKRWVEIFSLKNEISVV